MITRQQKKKIIKKVLKYGIPVILMLGLPITAFFSGLFLYASYAAMNLMATFPALTLIDFILLAVPFAAAHQIAAVQRACTMMTFKGKRKFLHAIRQSRQLNSGLHS